MAGQAGQRQKPHHDDEEGPAVVPRFAGTREPDAGVDIELDHRIDAAYPRSSEPLQVCGLPEGTAAYAVRRPSAPRGSRPQVPSPP